MKTSLRKEVFLQVADKYQQKLVENRKEQGFIRLAMLIVGADESNHLAKQLDVLKKDEKLFRKMVKGAREAAEML